MPRAGSLVVRVLRPSVQLIANSSFPFGMNDGPVWAGRGLTTVVRGGALVLAGPLTLRLEPVAFRAENNAFTLADNGLAGSARFRDPVSPNTIDDPQRFGAGAYQRIDLGYSELRADRLGVSVGVSSAPQSWGPATTLPIIMGPNAPGFLHVFLETSRPVSVFVGRVHARLIAGRLDQSAYSAAPDSLALRAGSGFVAAFLPRGLGGLEVGATRFFHSRWRGWGRIGSALRMPLEGLLFKRGQVAVDNPESAQFLADNQLASLFFRWPFAAAGFEFYGEYAREDAANDLRDLLAEPDHDSAYLLGVRHLIHGDGQRLTLVRGEWANGRITQLARVRPQVLFYLHNLLVQGHTNRGQVLGSPALRGGGGANVGVDFYGPTGRTSIDFHRIRRLAMLSEGAANAHQIDVQHALVVERSMFVRGIDVVGGLTGVWELNRDYRHDAANVGATVGVRLGSGDRAPSR